MKRTVTFLLAAFIAAPICAQDSKISDLANGTPAVGTDLFVIARGGANYRIPGSDFCLVGSCTMTAPILHAAGSALAPAIALSTQTNNGWYWTANPYMVYSYGNNPITMYNAGTPAIIMLSTWQHAWSTDVTGVAPDTGLARDSAGVVRATNGGAGQGDFKASNLWSGAVNQRIQLDGSTEFYFRGDFAQSINLNGQVKFGPIGIPDTGLARDAAGVIKATNGSSGNGAFYSAATYGFLVSAVGASGAGMGPSGGGGIVFRNDNGFATSRAIFAALVGGGLQVGSTDQYGFSSAGVNAASDDTGLARVSAGVVKATDGGATNYGELRGGGSTTYVGLSGDATYGNVSSSTGILRFRVNGTTAPAALITTHLELENTVMLSWGGVGAAQDTGLARDSAAVVRVADGGAGLGTLYAIHRGNNGSQSAPSYTFLNGSSTGWWNETSVSTTLQASVAGAARVAITPGKASITDNTATTIFRADAPSNSAMGLEIFYEAEVNSGGEWHAISGQANLTIINKAGTETCSSITETGENSVVSDAGTITFTWTCDTTPTNGVNLQATVDSSLDTASTVYVTVHRLGGGIGGLVSN